MVKGKCRYGLWIPGGKQRRRGFVEENCVRVEVLGRDVWWQDVEFEVEHG